MHNLIEILDTTRREAEYNQFYLNNTNTTLSKHIYRDICEDLCNVFETTKLFNQDVKVFLAGDKIPSIFYCDREDIVSNLQLVDFYSKGGTLVLHGAERFSPILNSINNRIADFFGVRMHVNCYLTPVGSSGAGFHVDDHDVFIMQVTGKKIWKVANEYLLDNYSKIKLIEVNFGDFLYIKKGVWHTTETHQHYSMHITFGLNSLMSVSLKKKDGFVIHKSQNTSKIMQLNHLDYYGLTCEINSLCLSSEVKLILDSYINKMGDADKYYNLIHFIENLFCEERFHEFIGSHDVDCETKKRLIKLCVKAELVNIYIPSYFAS
jgi:Cupin superfamily protein